VIITGVDGGSDAAEKRCRGDVIVEVAQEAVNNAPTSEAPRSAQEGWQEVGPADGPMAKANCVRGAEHAVGGFTERPAALFL